MAEEHAQNCNYDRALPLIGRDENMKLLFDQTMNGLLVGNADERRDARRRASNDAAFDHFVDMTAAVGFANAMIASQVGEDDTETAAGTTEEADAGDAIAGQAVATTLGNLASALVPIIAGASGVVSVQTLSVVLASVVAAAGSAAKAAGSPGA